MKTQTFTQKKQNNTSRISRKNWLTLSCIGLLFFVCQTSFAQVENNKTEVTNILSVKGVVEDIDGPLLGTNILLKNSSIGVTTDENGLFTFPKPLQIGDVLLVSSLGYKTQEIKITKAKTDLKIFLEFDQLDIVVVSPNSDKPFRTKRN